MNREWELQYRGVQRSTDVRKNYADRWLLSKLGGTRTDFDHWSDDVYENDIDHESGLWFCNDELREWFDIPKPSWGDKITLHYSRCKTAGSYYYEYEARDFIEVTDSDGDVHSINMATATVRTLPSRGWLSVEVPE